MRTSRDPTYILPQPLAVARGARHERLQASSYLESTVNERLGLLTGEARAVKTAMTTELMVASPHTTLKEATALMKDLGVPVIVVYDGHRVVGLLSDRDATLNHCVQEAAENTTIGKLMRTNVPTCLGDDRLGEAFSLMRASDADWLPVLDRGDRLVGVLSRYAAF